MKENSQTFQIPVFNKWKVWYITPPSYLKHYCTGNNCKSREHHIIYRRNNCCIKCIQGLKQSWIMK
jgi:hypothetical protein